MGHSSMRETGCSQARFVALHPNGQGPVGLYAKFAVLAPLPGAQPDRCESTFPVASLAPSGARYPSRVH